MKILKKGYYYFLKLKNRLFSGRPVLVLMYHRVNDFPQGNLSHLTVTNDDFEKQLQFLTKNYQILKLEEDWNNLKRTGVVITFDDGYADNLTDALPLLEKYNVPATIFVTTENLGTNEEYWWDRLQFDYEACRESFYMAEGKVVQKLEWTFAKLSHKIGVMSKLEKEAWFQNFENLNQIVFKPRPQNFPLSHTQLKTLSDHSLIKIGLHSHSHAAFSSLSAGEQKSDLEKNISVLKYHGIEFLPYLALAHGSYGQQTQKVMNSLNLKGMLLANNYYSGYQNKASGKINRILMPSISGKKLLKYLDYYDFKS